MVPDEVKAIIENTQSRIPVNTYETRRFDNWIWGPNGIIEDDDPNVVLWKALGRFHLPPALGRLPFLYIYGVAGVGKTHLALALGWNWLSMGEQVMFYETEDLLDILRAGFENGTFNKTVKEVKACRLLILDDIGGQSATEWAATKLDSIVNSRYVENRATIFTSNYPPDFKDAAGNRIIPERIADRCAEGMVVRMHGTSYRRRKHAKAN